MVLNFQDEFINVLWNRVNQTEANTLGHIDPTSVQSQRKRFIHCRAAAESKGCWENSAAAFRDALTSEI